MGAVELKLLASPIISLIWPLFKLVTAHPRAACPQGLSSLHPSGSGTTGRRVFWEGDPVLCLLGSQTRQMGTPQQHPCNDGGSVSTLSRRAQRGRQWPHRTALKAAAWGGSHPAISLCHSLKGWVRFVVVQLPSPVQLFVTPGTAARQDPVFHGLPEFAQILVHWVGDAIQPPHPLLAPLLLPSIFPSIRVFSNESALRIKWPKYWSFSFSISPSNEYSGWISFRMDWFALLAVQDSQESSPAPKFESINSTYGWNPRPLQGPANS